MMMERGGRWSGDGCAANSRRHAIKLQGLARWIAGKDTSATGVIADGFRSRNGVLAFGGWCSVRGRDFGQGGEPTSLAEMRRQKPRIQEARAETAN